MLSWGTIDDAFNWESAHQLFSFWPQLKSFISEDLAIGRLRPVYDVYLFVYRVFESSPKSLYFINWAGLFFSTYLISRTLLRASSSERVRQTHLTILMLAAFTFHPWTKLLLNLSLQEKLGLIAFSGVLWTLLTPYRQGHGLWLLQFLGFTTLMLLSKETFIAYGPPLLFLCWWKKGIKNHRGAATFICVSAMLIAAMLTFINIRKGYSASYSPSLAALAMNIPKAHVATLLLIGFSFLGCLRLLSLLLRRRKNFSLCAREALFFAGSVGVLSVCIVVVPWSSTDYYISPLLPWILAMFVPLMARVGALQMQIPEVVIVPVLSIILVIAGVFNLRPQLKRNAELTELTQVLRRIRIQGSADFALLDSCNETRDSLDVFSRVRLLPFDPTIKPHYFVRRGEHGTAGKQALWIEAKGCASPRSEKIEQRKYVYSGEYFNAFFGVAPL